MILSSTKFTGLKTLILKILSARPFSKLKEISVFQLKSNSEYVPLMCLKRSGFLGKKGDLFLVPRDRMMYRHMRALGSWDRSTIQFLVSNVKSAEQGKEIPHTLIDLGSNIGLISLQVLNQTTLLKSICIEPMASLMECASYNLVNYSNRVALFNFALAERDGSARFYYDEKNCGNGSLDSSLLPAVTSYSEVKTRSTKKFFEQEIDPSLNYVLKSDIQGSEAMVLSEIPPKSWAAINFAVIEIWATPNLDHLAVWKCAREFDKYDYVSWHPNKRDKIDSSELVEFWLRGDGQMRNIYLERI
jgi:FkbM family methyltransferase